MTSSKMNVVHFLRVAVGGLALATLLPAVSLGAPPDSNQPGAAAARASRGPAAERARRAKPQTRPWTIEDALPAHSSALGAPPPQRDGQFGRIPVQDGTLSLETKSQLDPRQAPEARRIPGLETDHQNMPSYLGLSLSVPTGKLFSPPPSPSEPTASTGPSHSRPE